MSLDVARYARLWRRLWWVQRLGLLPALVSTSLFVFFGFLNLADLTQAVATDWASELGRAPLSEETRRSQTVLLAACLKLLNDGLVDGRWWIVALTVATGLIVAAFPFTCGAFRLRLATVALAALAVVMVISFAGMLHAASMFPDSPAEQALLPEFDFFYRGVYLAMTFLLFTASLFLLLAQGVLVVRLWRHRLRPDLPRTHRMTHSLGVNLGWLQFTGVRLSAAGVATQAAALAVPLVLVAVFHRWILSAAIFGVIDILYLLVYLPVLVVSMTTAAVQGGALFSGSERETLLENIDDPAKLVAIAAVLMAARVAWRTGTRLHRRRRDDIVLKDKPPVLLLRSFADDVAGIPPNALLPRLFRRRRRLEETIGAELTEAGPFVAIGKPGERLPQLGAQRLYVADSEWQEVVRSYIARAGRIIMIAGTTHWVQWELASTIAESSLDKLLIVFPRITDVDRAARWENLMGAFHGTPWEPGAAAVGIAGALAVFTDSAGRFVVIRSRRAHESDYQSALRVATYLMRHGGARAAQTSRAARSPQMSAGPSPDAPVRPAVPHQPRHPRA